MSILQILENEQKRNVVAFRPGDTVRVHVRIVEGDKTRTQLYEGVVIGRRGDGNRESFTVRKICAGNIGVERVFPVQSPNIEKVEVVTRGKVRRARLNYLRDLRGKSARLKTRDDRKSSKKNTPKPAQV